MNWQLSPLFTVMVFSKVVILSSMYFCLVVMSMRLKDRECGTTTTDIHSSERLEKVRTS